MFSKYTLLDILLHKGINFFNSYHSAVPKHWPDNGLVHLKDCFSTMKMLTYLEKQSKIILSSLPLKLILSTYLKIVASNERLETLLLNRKHPMTDLNIDYFKLPCMKTFDFWSTKL